MPLIARGMNSGDMVTSPTGTPVPPVPCPAPLDVLIVGKSPNVIVAGVGVSRLTDDVMGHPYPPIACAPHIPLCVAASPNVFANALPVARMGDIYAAGDGELHPVTTITQSTVFAN